MKITERLLRKIIRDVINESMDPNDIMSADASSHGRFFDEEVQKSSLIDTLEKQYTDSSQLKKVVLMLPMKQRLLEAGIMKVINDTEHRHVDRNYSNMRVGTRLWLLMYHPHLLRDHLNWSLCKESQNFIEQKSKKCLNDINSIREKTYLFTSLLQ